MPMRPLGRKLTSIIKGKDGEDKVVLECAKSDTLSLNLRRKCNSSIRCWVCRSSTASGYGDGNGGECG
eukprot:370803-Ditylum_brightwellii.AAC.1